VNRLFAVWMGAVIRPLGGRLPLVRARRACAAYEAALLEEVSCLEEDVALSCLSCLEPLLGDRTGCGLIDGGWCAFSWSGPSANL